MRENKGEIVWHVVCQLCAITTSAHQVKEEAFDYGKGSTFLLSRTVSEDENGSLGKQKVFMI